MALAAPPPQPMATSIHEDMSESLDEEIAQVRAESMRLFPPIYLQQVELTNLDTSSPGLDRTSQIPDFLSFIVNSSSGSPRPQFEEWKQQHASQ